MTDLLDGFGDGSEDLGLDLSCFRYELLLRVLLWKKRVVDQRIVKGTP